MQTRSITRNDHQMAKAWPHIRAIPSTLATLPSAHSIRSPGHLSPDNDEKRGERRASGNCAESAKGTRSAANLLIATWNVFHAMTCFLPHPPSPPSTKYNGRQFPIYVYIYISRGRGLVQSRRGKFRRCRFEPCTLSVHARTPLGYL